MNKDSLNNFMPLNTERLKIRKTLLDDIDLLLKLDKQEITQLYLGGVKNKTYEERIIFLKDKIDKNISLTVCLFDNTPIGFVDLKENDSVLEISYIFDFDYSNKGYCTEACKSIINLVFNYLNINKIYANVILGNDSSKSVLEKLGFNYIGSKKIDEYMFLEYELIK